MVNSNDFSMFALFTAGFAALTNAYAVAIGPFPVGNPFNAPAQGSTVNVGEPFTVQWAPTVGQTVTLYLCEGPSTNCVNHPVPIANEIPNSGSFSWTPTADLIPTQGQGYGIQLVVVGTGEYQWTPQFGIANPSYGNVPEVTPTATITASLPIETLPTVSASTIIVTPTVITPILPTGTGGVPTTVVPPTAVPTLPTTLHPTTSAVHTPTSTPPPSNGAGKLGAGFALAFAAGLAHLIL